MKTLSSLLMTIILVVCGCSSNDSSSDIGTTADRVARSPATTNPGRNQGVSDREKTESDRGIRDDRRNRQPNDDAIRNNDGRDEINSGRSARDRNRSMDDRDRLGDTRNSPGQRNRGRDSDASDEPAEKISLVAAFPGSDSVVGLDKGNLVPEITGLDLEGTEFNLSDYQGKVIMLDFWGDW